MIISHFDEDLYESLHELLIYLLRLLWGQLFQMAALIYFPWNVLEINISMPSTNHNLNMAFHKSSNTFKGHGILHFIQKSKFVVVKSSTKSPFAWFRIMVPNFLLPLWRRCWSYGISTQGSKNAWESVKLAFLTKNHLRERLGYGL